MKPKDVFSVAVRIIGLAFMYQGLVAVPVVLDRFCPIFPPPPLRYLNFRSVIPGLFSIAWPLAIAWWMVRGAPWLMRLAYGDEEPNGNPRGQTARQETSPLTPS